ncbi:hypothetical protein FTX61_09835 [Nitriliruptoraceae bacterium ZYF776]|nr:hypothetical protein [Profundirhabdus halotolerans]
MRRRSLPALSAALVLVAGLTACNGDEAAVEEDPAGALRDAVAALEDYDGLELTFSIDGDRQAASEAIEAGELSEEDFELLVESSFVVRSAQTSDTEGEVQMLVNLRGTEVADLRFVEGERFFVRVDLDAIGEEVDDPTFESELEGMVGAAEMFGLGDAAASLREGDWIELTGFEQLTSMMEAQMGQTEEPSEEELEQIQARVSSALGQFVEEDAQVTAVGSEDAGERVRVTASAEDVEALLTEMQTIVADVSGLGDAEMAELDAQVGELEGDLTFDAWISGGELSQVAFDFGVLEGGEPTDEAYLYIGIAEFGGGVDVPSEATAVDLFEIFGQFAGGMGDLGGMGGDPFGDDPMGEEDPFADDPALEEGDDPAADGGELDPGAGDPAAECITEEDLAQAEEALGEEGVAELEALIEQGFLERC